MHVAADIEQQDHVQRFPFKAEVHDALFFTLVTDAKIFFFEAGNNLSAGVGNGGVHSHERYARAKHNIALRPRKASQERRNGRKSQWNIDFAIMPWTPFLPSTSWVISKSAAML